MGKSRARVHLPHPCQVRQVEDVGHEIQDVLAGPAVVLLATRDAFTGMGEDLPENERGGHQELVTPGGDRRGCGVSGHDGFPHALEGYAEVKALVFTLCWRIYMMSSAL